MPMLRTACLLTLLTAALPAQTWSFPLNPRATYLRTNSDSPTAALVIDLATLGIAPGTWLRVGSTGGFRYVSGGQDGYHAMIAVFSSSNTLLATNVPARVPGAIAAGPAFPSAATYHGAVPTDIPQDFFASRTTWDRDVLVRVPTGALFLFVGSHDSLYGDNSDPNGDYAAVVTVAPTPSLPGTGEHLELRAAVGATPVSSPDVHTTTPGVPMLAELHYPVGFADGSTYVFVGDVVATGSPIPEVLPNLWTPNLILLQGGVLPSTGGWTDVWSMSTPGGYSGLTIVIQAGALVTTARNGIYVTTNAHRFVL